METLLRAGLGNAVAATFLALIVVVPVASAGPAAGRPARALAAGPDQAGHAAASTRCRSPGRSRRPPRRPSRSMSRWSTSIAATAGRDATTSRRSVEARCLADGAPKRSCPVVSTAAFHADESADSTRIDASRMDRTDLARAAHRSFCCSRSGGFAASSGCSTAAPGGSWLEQDWVDELGRADRTSPGRRTLRGSRGRSRP